MAEQVVLVCDVCGNAATSGVIFTVQSGGGRAAGQRYAKDLCNTHLSELVANARKPRRGRRRASVTGSSAGASSASATPKRRGRPRKVATAAPKRRGRPRKSATSTAASGAAPRRRGRPPKALTAAGGGQAAVSTGSATP